MAMMNFIVYDRWKLNTVAFEGVGRVGGMTVHGGGGMTVHGSSATNPPAIVLRVLQYGQYAALFRFSTDSNERQGQSWHSQHLLHYLEMPKKEKKNHTAHKNITS